MGAHETIDYRVHPEWNALVRQLTNGTGVDLTVEVGGAETMERSLAATRVGGRLAPVGLLTGRPNSASLVGSSGVDISVVRVGSRQDFEAMNRAIDFHDIHPIIDSRYEFEQLPAALSPSEKRPSHGKNRHPLPRRLVERSA